MASPSAEKIGVEDGGKKAGMSTPSAAANPANPDAGAGPAEDPPVQALQEPAARVVPTKRDIFMLARQQHFDALLRMLQEHPQLWHERDEDGHSLLHWGALVGNKDFVLEGLRQDLPVDVPAENRQTPLMWACLRGHATVARCLVNAKANIHWQDSLGATPIMIALQHQQYLSMLFLVNRGDRQKLLQDADKNGCTSAHWAAYKGDLMTLRLIEYFGGDLMRVDVAGMQPLHRAASMSHVPAVQFLAERDADLSATNGEGRTCLMIAEGNTDLHMQSVLKHLEKVQAKKREASRNAGAATSVADVEAGLPDKKAGGMKGVMKDRQMHILFPLFWFVCVSAATFEYMVEMRVQAYTSAPNAALLFEFGVPFTLFVFAITALGDPGKVPPRVRGNSAVEELMRQIDTDEPPAADVLNRLCTTTWVLKGLRTKYCAQTGACVEEFDHYCIWLNCAIGKKNHRPFVLLALAEFLTQVGFIVVFFHVSRDLVPFQGFTSWPFQIILGHPLMTLTTLLHCITAPWVFMLLLHQLRLVAQNMTTNEMINAYRYEHFWVSNGIQRAFRNPFDKGGKIRNCFDFFWYRNRAEKGPGAGHAPCH